MMREFDEEPTESVRVAFGPDPDSERRLAWFREAKAGLFIHWGLYALRGGIKPDGHPIGGSYTEWYMARSGETFDEYSRLAGQFNPTRFDADEWAATAAAAGMRYITLTTKHHDGFCLFRSAVSPYNIVDATPFGRDVTGELRDACRRQGLRFFCYYSHCQDWSHRDAWGVRDHFFPDSKNHQPDHERYLNEKALPQVRELIQQYQPDGFWFDTPWFNEQAVDRRIGKRFTDLVRELAPDCLINSRVVEGSKTADLNADLYDFRSLKDQGLPGRDSPVHCECPDSVSRSFGYDRRADATYCTPQTIIQRMSTTISRGANYLLNIGPDADGEIPPQARHILGEVGRWVTSDLRDSQSTH